MSTVKCPHCGRLHRSEARYCPLTGKMLPAGGLKAALPPVQEGITGKLPPNTFLRGRYMIVRKVGQGGMAAVYQATDTFQPGTLWAIKEMSDLALTSTQDRAYAVECFNREATLLRTLNHVNLPKVVDAFTEGGKHYLVMEYIFGETLLKLLSRRTQPFSEEEVRQWALQLCEVLTYLHEQNPKIIFRDMKPSNIMLTPHGQVKLIDFGIARFFKPWKDKDTMALGTPGYAAPEAGSGQTDERSDLYSLCVVLHQLLSLHNPATTIFNLPPLRSLNPLVSVEMEGIIMRGVQNQREARWGSARELRAALLHQAARGFSPPAGMQAVNYLPPTERAPSVEGLRIPGNAQAFHPAVQVIPPSAAKAPSPAVVSVSRPTTRLLMAAVKLDPRQLIGISAAILGALVLVTWFLAEPLSRLNLAWNNLASIIAVFGSAGYAAYPRRGTAFLTHVFFSVALIATLWLRVPQGYPWANLILGALISGIVMELWMAMLPWVMKKSQREGWKMEALWMALMGMLGTTLLLGLATEGAALKSMGLWLFSPSFALLGWFMGDMLKQYLTYKRTGLWRDS